MRLKNPQSDSLSNWKTNQKLIGVINGLNRFFTTPHKFVYDVSLGLGPIIKRNGQTVYLDVELKSFNESGGAGTGYDIIEFRKPPKQKDTLIADYIAVE